MTPEQLKASVLNSALSGRLTNNFFDNDTELPVGWKKEKMGNIMDIVVGATPSTSNISYWENGTIPWLPSGVCQNCDVIDAPKYITQVGYDSCSTKMMPPNTVLIALTGATAGKVGFLKIKACGNQSVVGILPSEDMEQRYIFYYLIAKRNDILADCVGSAQPHISKAYIVNMDMIVPPLEEQKRIVARIEEILPLVDRYAEAYEKLERFNSKFPDEMRKSIIQYAIQGKLVEQRLEDGTAEELYQQIQGIKLELIKKKEIKKDKQLDDITSFEPPFDIPTSWKWIRVGELAKKVTDGEHKTPKRVSEYCGFYLLSARNVLNGAIRLDDVDYVDAEEYEKISVRCNPKRNDILISCSGSVGRCTVVEDDNCYVMVRSAAMISPILINSRYLMYAIQSECVQSQIKERTKQAVQANLFQDAILNLVIPIPPLNEQDRIVSEIEKLIPYCDSIKKLVR